MFLAFAPPKGRGIMLNTRHTKDLSRKKKIIQVSSPILRDVRFRYQDDEILSRSLTSTNFHTYYQGSEMVVAGRLPPSSPGTKHSAAAAAKEKAASGNKLIEYEIHATQAQGHEYSVAGSYNGSAVSSRK